MANDLTLPQGFVPAPEFLNDSPLGSESLADGIGSGYPLIGYRGGKWTLRYRGETYPFVRPDDGSPSHHIDVIILRQNPGKSKSFYAEGFDEGTMGKRPTCASMDGIAPDNDVLEKQSDVCKLCPRDEWRTMANGRRGKECQDFKRLAVMLLPATTTQMLGSPLVEPVFLRVPAASLNELAAYGTFLEGQGAPYTSVVTRISFDPSVAYPRYKFRGIKGLTSQEAETVLSLRHDPMAFRITGEAQDVQRRRPPSPAVRALASGDESRLRAVPAPVADDPPVDITVTPAAAPPKGNGSNGAHVVLNAAPTDAGEPEEADAALAAEIEALLSKPLK